MLDWRLLELSEVEIKIGTFIKDRRNGTKLHYCRENDVYQIVGSADLLGKEEELYNFLKDNMYPTSNTRLVRIEDSNALILDNLGNALSKDLNFDDNHTLEKKIFSHLKNHIDF